eukprot:CAMPEP_0113256998 /NCGR_PEP_ID=MMETSP0008_2-20120614/15068_1 /TAXON_ID=97485 /ORGANISM="Prymnesium parvum" /LENGTH=507 /DNA_ID=CAMNT_0000105389 /DNA_START=7 /DNA_END=1530 /DNA_ORIENTATION=+ /assembly_acc=CAM_ASM_000153
MRVALLLLFAAEACCSLSLKTIPTTEDMSQRELTNYWNALNQIPSGAAEGGQLTASFKTADIPSTINVNTTGVPPNLQGIWWWNEHPTIGQALFTFWGADKDFHGNAGVTPASTGYTYVSTVKPRALAVPNTKANRSKLAFLTSYELEFALPYFNDSTKPGAATPFNTHLDFPFRKFPLPAALLEGWDLNDQLKWDPKESSDAAQCFCSMLMRPDGSIERHNFGRYAYSGYRLFDGKLKPTAHWPIFKAKMQQLGIDEFVTSEGSASRRAVTPLAIEDKSTTPAHPNTAALLGASYQESASYEVDGKPVWTASGKSQFSWGGLHAPAYLLAFTEMYLRRAGSPVDTSRVSWIGWNNVLTQRVDRYLIVEELDASQKVIQKKCLTYPDHNTPGYVDPILIMANRYKLVDQTSANATYRYVWELASGATQTSMLTTPLNGVPATGTSARVSADKRSGSKTRYDFKTAEAGPVNFDLFYQYKQHDCITVANFSAPDVCVNSWLTLQYECS